MRPIRLALVLGALALSACDPADVQRVVAQPAVLETTTTTTTQPGPSCCTEEQARYIEAKEAEKRSAEFHQAVRDRFAQHPLRPIAGCESSYVHRPHGEPVWDRYNMQGSTASGGLQILNGTWDGWKHAVPEAVQYARAAHAPDWIQMEVGMRAYDRNGTTPWNASRYCWG